MTGVISVPFLTEKVVLRCKSWIQLGWAALICFLVSIPLANDDAAAGVGATNVQWLIVTGSHVNVRAAPELTADRLALYRRGKPVHRVRKHGDWLLVRDPNTSETGWIHADYMTPITPGEASVFLREQVARNVIRQSSVTTANRPKRPLRLFVYGDSLATNLFYGMKSGNGHNTLFTLHRRTRGATGLVRDDEYDWYGRMGRYLKIDRPDVAVVTFGGNDRQDIISGRGRIKRFTRKWWHEYRRRVDRFMTRMTRHSEAVYWLGLPILRSERMTTDYRKLSRLYRELARRHGITYVDIWETFKGPNGGYTAFGTGVDGRRRQLRHTDGIHFSNHGSRKLAQVVVEAIKSDIRANKLATR